MRTVVLVMLWLAAAGGSVLAQAPSVTGRVVDETGGALPGVVVELHEGGAVVRDTITDAMGGYAFDGLAAGTYDVTFRLVNFGMVRRAVQVAGAPVEMDAILRLAIDADVVVTGRRTFTNLADAENPAEDLVGIALTASQGAITGQQLEARPIMRAGEVLETVPGVIISQHSGEGKANQYYLRGFNLDHGTDFATTVGGMPVNLPTHGHGHGYSDANFLIPELVSGVQFSKGPYFADQGDFATAGAANINYVNVLDRPTVTVGGGQDGFGRAFAAVSPAVGAGHVLAALEVQHNDGPWTRPDDYQKLNGVVRYSQGDAVNGFSVTAMAYRATWDSTDQIPQRAVDAGLIGRFGNLDGSDGGDTYRYSGSMEWQRSSGTASTRVVGYGFAYDMSLFSNFTYFLDDPVHGDQFEQADHRFVAGGRVTHRRIGRWGGRAVQNTIGVDLRNDDIGTVGLYHTESRRRLETVREDAVLQTSAAVFAQNETEWTPWVRTVAGLRMDGYRFDVEAGDPANAGTTTAGLVSPKGGVAIGPFQGTEIYANAGYGFHSNDARGATIRRDPKTGEPADPVTPLVRATGAEVGLRSVAVPHLQTTVSLWTLGIDSELLFVGDAGTTEASRPSRRWGIEWANYYRVHPTVVLDADVSISRARFTDEAPEGDRIPGAVERVISAGVTVEPGHRFFGSLRLRYFGPRPLIEDDSVRSAATTLLNAEAGIQLRPGVRLALDLFNLLDVKDSDIDYFYASRLPGEPADGLEDLHLHPTLPRTARISLIVGF
ncbi:MAG: TonB-dependent receptor [Vicinamibacterales bacterium]